ncbi:GNAT family N-acetyltransferase [Actinomycetospora cinnamomea]|uniref:Acetyltransferase (GNAT) family protein n=1 Tax=Actinomycetospora cinnamomea TaxID=663609 RepID=A0A2U1EC80_9PSEU|nr:GNAT family N-acetyltransferase [Actinomycetospora cinnamomea]PVY97309.1 acetyltransferase (GNAT) family protein [Actinomycetospora cinnamomea]
METTLRVRLLRPDDTATLDAVFDGLSARSRYLRFHSPMPRLSGTLRRGLLRIDDHDRLALVAEAATGTGTWEPVGIARLVRTAAREAELAVAVVDAWQRRGVGRVLLTALRVAARARGVDRLVAYVLAENAAARELIAQTFPLCTTRRDGAVVVMTCHLTDDLTLTVDDLVA